MAPKCVLVVDDDLLICWGLKRELSARDVGVHAVATAEDALTELRGASRFDLVFLDVGLPDANGFDLLDEIRSAAPGTKVVMMSAEAGEANRRRALDGGALQFLEKPFDISEVDRIARSALFEYPIKRRHARHHCRVSIRISVVEAHARGDSLDLDSLAGQVADVGPGGLRLQTEFPLQVGQRVCPWLPVKADCLSMYMPPGGLAEVVWVSPSDQGVVAGLRFLA